MSRFLLGSLKHSNHVARASARTPLYTTTFCLTGPPHTIPRLLRFYYFGRPYSSSSISSKCSTSPSSHICFLQLSATKAFSSFAFRRLYHVCSSNYSPIMKLARAMSLSLARSNLVAHSVISILIGKFARTETSWAHAERFDALCLQAQDGHIHLGLNSEKHGSKWFIKLLKKQALPLSNGGNGLLPDPDLFAQDLCDELTKLHTNAPAHSFMFTRKSIEMAYGRKLSEIFDNFDEEPVASGSIAQIHRATLKFRYPGQPIKPILVAVKVRHPGVGEAIRRDFAIINFLATVSNFIPTLRWLRLDESIQQFAVFMMSQVDLAKEAANLSRFIYNFRSSKDVSFPRPLYPLVHPAVLVETYEHGESISYYVDQLKGRCQIKNALAHIGTRAPLKMLLVDNFIHADVHPGNILVRTKSNTVSDGIFKSGPQLVFLDVGMTAELSKRDRVNLIEFFKAVSLRDGRTAAECTLRLSNKQSCPDPEAFINEVETYFHFWGTPEGESIHPAECIQQLLEQVRRHRVNIDGNVCTVMVTTLVLEGWQQKLDPKYDVMHTLQNLLFKADWAESLQYTIEGAMAP